MPGAGKSTIADGLKSKGFDVINMGDVVRAEAKKRKLEPTGKNLGKLMLDLREKNGPGAIAELITEQITKTNSTVIVIDGIRSNAEIDVLRKTGKVKILAIHASTNTRFSFLTKRGRSDDPQNQEVFNERDAREIGVGVSNSIALADESISNNNMTINELINVAYKIIKGWVN
ncbi:MAG: dephospho-CoA kinase [Thaumarchaeota archaeon]|nr:dephospho-CoA kinase [Nitrososphaerota archaeon]